MKRFLFLLLIIGCATGQGFAVDSCLENDGGINSLQPGEVRGFENGTLYKHTDFCLIDGTLAEYSCDGTSFVRTDINCSCERNSFDIGFCE